MKLQKDDVKFRNEDVQADESLEIIPHLQIPKAFKQLRQPSKLLDKWSLQEEARLMYYMAQNISEIIDKSYDTFENGLFLSMSKAVKTKDFYQCKKFFTRKIKEKKLTIQQFLAKWRDKHDPSKDHNKKSYDELMASSKLFIDKVRQKIKETITSRLRRIARRDLNNITTYQKPLKNKIQQNLKRTPEQIHAQSQKYLQNTGNQYHYQGRIYCEINIVNSDVPDFQPTKKTKNKYGKFAKYIY